MGQLVKRAASEQRQATSVLPTSPFLVLLAAALVASMSYGVTLPLMPTLVESVAPAAAAQVASHTGWLTATFTLGLFLLSPLWGALSDRVERRFVIAAGLAGSGAALWALDLPLGLPGLYASRFLAGAMTAAVMPAVFAYVAEATSSARRQERFAWIATATSLGFLLGPVAGNLLGDMVAAASGRPMVDSAFAVVAYLSFASGFAVLALPRSPADAQVADRTNADEARLRRSLPLTAIVVLAITVAEVGLTLLSRDGGVVRPRQVAVYFGLCSATMVGMQLWAYPRFEARLGESRMVTVALVSLVAGVALLSWPHASWVPALSFLLGGSAVGILIPALAVRVSRAAGTRPGWGLGRQAAAANLGQALGAAATGMLYALSPPAPFLAAALVVAMAALAERQDAAAVRTA